jgi:hypothetical protein
MLQVFRHARRAVAGHQGLAAVNARWTQQRPSAGPSVPDLDPTGSAARVVTELCGVAARSRPLRFGFIGGGVMAEGEWMRFMRNWGVLARDGGLSCPQWVARESDWGCIA